MFQRLEREMERCESMRDRERKRGGKRREERDRQKRGEQREDREGKK